jgi:hypothetical protein
VKETLEEIIKKAVACLVIGEMEEAVIYLNRSLLMAKHYEQSLGEMRAVDKTLADCVRRIELALP